MWRRLMVISGLFLAGCAASRPAPTASNLPNLSAVPLQSRAAAALVFTPPATLGMPVLDLSRDGREPEAFWGYSQGTTDFYDVQLDDVQVTDPYTGGYRESISERAGTSYR